MTWLARTGVGIGVIAALALGRAVTDAWPADTLDDRPFVHAAELGDTVRLRYADVTVDRVRAATTVTTGVATVTTPARWLVVELTVVARGETLGTSPSVLVEDARGRMFEPDPRTGHRWAPAPTGVPWHVRIPFEMPGDALEGAVVRIAREGLDQRRDDIAVVDLGIDATIAAELGKATDTVPVGPPSFLEQP